VKAEQIREMGVEELRGKERELQEQLFRLRFQRSSASSTTP
jgi:ribosomal protein L29